MNILTFDIEDWYNHDDYSQDFEWDKFEVRLYEGVDRILAALDEEKLHGTFFCLGWVAEKHPQIIRKIHDAGHHIGCHSYQHQLATRMSVAAFENDCRKAKKLLEDVCGAEVNAYRVPSFSITEKNIRCFETLAGLGFKYDCSVFPAQHEFGGISRFPSEPFTIRTQAGDIHEFPVSLGSLAGRKIVYTGGGYFRIVPYWLLRRLVRRSSYVMSYFHPSDFDPGQPRMPQLSPMRQFKNRVALKGAYSKFRKFLSDFDFLPLEEADRQTDWHESTIIEV